MTPALRALVESLYRCQDLSNAKPALFLSGVFLGRGFVPGGFEPLPERTSLNACITSTYRIADFINIVNFILMLSKKGRHCYVTLSLFYILIIAVSIQVPRYKSDYKWDD